MQAEHIPVHLGAMPAAVAAVRDRDHARGRLVGPQRPLRGRHPPARHHGRHARLPRRRAARLRRRARPPRRRRRARARARCRPTRRRSRRRASSSRRACSTTRAIDELAEQMRQPAQRRADLRAQLAANRTGARRLGELADRVGLDFLREATAAVLDYAERRTRACLADARRRHARRPSTCSRRPTATSSCAWRADRRRRRADARLHAARPPSTRATSTARWR